MNSVDATISKKMIEYSENNEKLYEWLDIIQKQMRIRKEMATCVLSNLYEQLRHIKGNQYRLHKVKMYMDYVSENVTEFILHEINDGLLVTQLADKQGNRSHTVGIDADEN